jgi:hypothetical protein
MAICDLIHVYYFDVPATVFLDFPARRAELNLVEASKPAISQKYLVNTDRKRRSFETLWLLSRGTEGKCMQFDTEGGRFGQNDCWPQLNVRYE